MRRSSRAENGKEVFPSEKLIHAQFEEHFHDIMCIAFKSLYHDLADRDASYSFLNNQFQGFAVEQSESMTGSMPGLIVSLPAALTATTVNGNTVIIGAVECTVYLGSVMNLGSQGALNLLVVCLDPSQTYVFPSS